MSRFSGYPGRSYSRFALVSLLLVGTAGITLSAALAHAAIGQQDLDVPFKDTAKAASVTTHPPFTGDPDKVDFLADSVAYDETRQIITATGQVEIAQQGKIIKADQVIYDLPQDTVEAVGNVAMMDTNGDVHFAERMQLQRSIKDGYIKKLRSVLADGSRITAAEGKKTGGKTVMKNASYTPCEECKAHPEKPVLWQIVADEVSHDKDEHAIEYKNAKFEIYGVPVLYTPYFSHTDGTIKQKDGFLMPKMSLNSRLGFGVTSKYYLGISPSEDATIGARVFSKNNPQLLGTYRKRYDHAEMEFDSSGTYSDDTEQFRGHLFGKGLWDINDKWRAGFKNQLTSDDKYLREYNITSENVLENQIYAERFEDRDYFVARALAFQDVRVSDRSVDQPNILPELQASFMGDPNATLGGRWNLDLSSLNLLRKGNGQDVFRTSADASWERKDVLPIGLVNQFTISSRVDAYQISDRDEISIVGGAGDAQAFRFYPYIHDVVSYPVSKNIGSALAVIEPTFALTTSLRTKNTTDIPNEDSQDVQIDAVNIFQPNRFPGLDRVEDGTHVTYGARTGIYAADGSKGEVFLGQSYRLDDWQNPFPKGSGLSEDESDLVGQVMAQYQDLYSLNYRFQFASQNLQSERHEVYGFAHLGDLSLSSTYLYARTLDGTDLQDSRQQIYGSASYHLNEDWNLLTDVRYDLSKEEQGLRYSGIGVNYIGQCFTVLTTLRRSYADKDTGEAATEFSVQLGLKNLGSIGTNE
ncbi:MAG TPA: LPS-assembly protein LptD [Rhodospirillaceae bacterium]|nr:LPS-assembly protein LptD [Rhodospirillaceae bacterium]